LVIAEGVTCVPSPIDQQISANAPTTAARAPASPDATALALGIGEAAQLRSDEVLARLSSSPAGLTSDEATRRMRVTFTPWAHALGFRALPAGYFAALIAMIVAYLTLVEFTGGPTVSIPSMLPSV
jgi:hypothetical protein